MPSASKCEICRLLLTIRMLLQAARQAPTGARKTVRERAGWWGDSNKLNAWYGPDRKKVFGEAAAGLSVTTLSTRLFPLHAQASVHHAQSTCVHHVL